VPTNLKLTTVADLIHAVSQVDAGALTGNRAPTIPQAGQQLTASLLFFVAALRGGSVRSWIGERGMAAADASSSPDLLTRLTSEFTGASRAMAEPLAGEWRTLSIPFQHGQQLHELLLHYHGNGRSAGKGDDDDDGAKRIMVDFTLSRSGPMRLDGLLGQKRFDLLVRSINSLPDWMQNDVVRLFASACEASGLVGSVGFRTGREGWATIREDTANPAGYSQLA